MAVHRQEKQRRFLADLRLQFALIAAYAGFCIWAGKCLEITDYYASVHTDVNCREGELQLSLGRWMQVKSSA